MEVEVALGCGIVARAAVPSGASTGENEAFELRDGDKTVTAERRPAGGKNINNVIQPELIGFDALDQAGLMHC